MTIINPSDMTRHYSLWGVSLALVATFIAMMYWFQPTPLWPALSAQLPAIIKPVLISVAGLCGLLALSFKFVFAHELVAWLLLHLIALSGTIGIGLFGYHELWLLYYATALAGLLILGPYLHFD